MAQDAGAVQVALPPVWTVRTLPQRSQAWSLFPSAHWVSTLPQVSQAWSLLLSAQALVSVWGTPRVQVRVWVAAPLSGSHAPQRCLRARIVPPQTVQTAVAVQVDFSVLPLWLQIFHQSSR